MKTNQICVRHANTYRQQVIIFQILCHILDVYIWRIYARNRIEHMNDCFNKNWLKGENRIELGLIDLIVFRWQVILCTCESSNIPAYLSGVHLISISSPLHRHAMQSQETLKMMSRSIGENRNMNSSSQTNEIRQISISTLTFELIQNYPYTMKIMMMIM